MSAVSVIERKLKGIETEYARKGYRVMRASELSANLQFLKKYRPDLVAEREDDHVVIEVKSARSLKGANQLRELAEEIASQPGWRFEVITVDAAAEELEALRQPEWLDSMLRWDPTEPFGMREFIYLIEVLSVLVRGIALLSDIKVKGKSAGLLATELAFAGIITQSQLERLQSYLTLRDELMHGLRQPELRKDQGMDIIALCRDLHSDHINGGLRSVSRSHDPK